MRTNRTLGALLCATLFAPIQAQGICANIGQNELHLLTFNPYQWSPSRFKELARRRWFPRHMAGFQPTALPCLTRSRLLLLLLRESRSSPAERQTQPGL
jgi:hypothetical protein